MNYLGTRGPGEAMAVLGFYFDFGPYECTEVMTWFPQPVLSLFLLPLLAQK